MNDQSTFGTDNDFYRNKYLYIVKEICFREFGCFLINTIILYCIIYLYIKSNEIFLFQRYCK